MHNKIDIQRMEKQIRDLKYKQKSFVDTIEWYDLQKEIEKLFKLIEIRKDNSK